MPVGDTLKRRGGGRPRAAHRARDGLWRALTPQMFRYGVLRRALRAVPRARAQRRPTRPRRSRRSGCGRGWCAGTATTSRSRIRRTSPLGRRPILGERGASDEDRVSATTCTPSGAGDHVMLGGVRIPHDQGVRGALGRRRAAARALRRAARRAGPGRHRPALPRHRPALEGRRQPALPAACARLLREHGYRLVNADLTVLAEAPRLGPHRAQMRANLADDLGTTPDRINVKATTSEGLGAIGRGEGLACHAVVLLAQVERAVRHGHAARMGRRGCRFAAAPRRARRRRPPTRPAARRRRRTSSSRRSSASSRTGPVRTRC